MNVPPMTWRSPLKGERDGRGRGASKCRCKGRNVITMGGKTRGVFVERNGCDGGGGGVAQGESWGHLSFADKREKIRLSRNCSLLLLREKRCFC